MICPKCKRYELQEDKSASAPCGTQFCPCGYVNYNYTPVDIDQATSNRKENVKAKVFRMMEKGYTDEHIRASFSVSPKTIEQYMHEGRRKLRIKVLSKKGK
jgi:DNA-directed RNA polymerase specialized sigma24 family protein